MQGLWAQCTKSPIDSHESQKKVTFSTWCIKNEIFLIHVVKNNLCFTLGLDFYLFNSACCCTWLQIFFSLQNSVENSYLISISKEDFRIFFKPSKDFFRKLGVKSFVIYCIYWASRFREPLIFTSIKAPIIKAILKKSILSLQ